MFNLSKSFILELPGGIVRIKQPEREGESELFVLLHGWTGDEDAMWIFTSQLPEHAYWVAPRGFYRATLGGYSWLSEEITNWPKFSDFQPAMERLFDLLDQLPNHQLKPTCTHIIGFSLGAALGMSLFMRYPERLATFAGLSGFLPLGIQEFAQPGMLAGKEVFLAHGNQDAIVPVEKARQAAELFRLAGANVILCEDDVGHKLSASCFRAMGKFFSRRRKC